MPPDLEERLRAAVAALPAGLRGHVLRVETEAVQLTQRFGGDVERARLAALGHDLVRHKSEAELLALAGRYGLQPDSVELEMPILCYLRRAAWGSRPPHQLPAQPIRRRHQDAPTCFHITTHGQPGQLGCGPRSRIEQPRHAIQRKPP
jgi:hypothetical protein